LFMSAEKEKLEKLVERIDELLMVLNKISEDLRTLSASMKSMAVSQITQPAPQAPAPVSHEIHEKKSIEDLRMAFPEDLEHLLSFEEKGDYIIVKPKQFLGSENFAKIASAVRGMGGEYISAGRDSHFRVPKERV
jgi:dsDNA-specific endonuclease/ATPase MutS2